MQLYYDNNKLVNELVTEKTSKCISHILVHKDVARFSDFDKPVSWAKIGSEHVQDGSFLDIPHSHKFINIRIVIPS